MACRLKSVVAQSLGLSTWSGAIGDIRAKWQNARSWPVTHWSLSAEQVERSDVDTASRAVVASNCFGGAPDHRNPRPGYAAADARRGI